MDNIGERYLESLNNESVGTAWQYVVRQQKELSESDNPYWLDSDLDLKNAVVKEVSRDLAKKIIEEYEWLGCMPAISQYYYGIFFGELCGGVVVFGTEYSENTGVWDKYGYTGKMILLSRGVCLHWTPKNTNSKLVMSAIKMLPEKYEVITCTTDELAGEVGTIYQACNFHYVGVMRKNKEREGVLLDDKLYGSRSIIQKFGTRSMKKILEENPTAVRIPQKAKARYFLFRKNQKKHLKAIEHLIKPYPKRKQI